MSRQEMIDALVALGFDASLLTEAVPDATLAEFLAFLQPEPAPEVPAVDAMADLSRDEMIAKLVESGEDAEALAAKSDEEVKAMFDQKFPPEAAATAMADRSEMVAKLLEKGHSQEELDALDDAGLTALYDQEFPAAADATPMSERAKKQKRAKKPQSAKPVTFAEIKDDVVGLVKQIVGEATRQLRADLGTTRGQTKQLLANTKRANIVAFCEALRNEGRLLPAEFTSVVERLQRADGTRVVRRFSDKGTTRSLTELDLQMDELRKRAPIVQFAERFVDPVTGADGEVQKVEQHFEAFSETYKKSGTTKEKLVKAFQSLRKSDPRYTANEFLNVRK